MPSAGPQIWMTSSRVSFSRSAPEGCQRRVDTFTLWFFILHWR